MGYTVHAWGCKESDTTERLSTFKESGVILGNLHVIKSKKLHMWKFRLKLRPLKLT